MVDELSHRQAQISHKLYSDLSLIIKKYLPQLLDIFERDSPEAKSLRLLGAEAIHAQDIELISLLYARYLNQGAEVQAVAHEFFSEFTTCIDGFTKANNLSVRELVKAGDPAQLPEPFKEIKSALWSANQRLKDEALAGKAENIRFFRSIFKDPSRAWMRTEIQPIITRYLKPILAFAETLGDDDEQTAHYISSGDATHNGLMSFMRMWHKVRNRPHPKAIDDCANQIISLIGEYMRNAGIARHELAGAFSGGDYRQNLQAFWDTGHQMIVITTSGFPSEVVDKIAVGKNERSAIQTKFYAGLTQIIQNYLPQLRPIFETDAELARGKYAPYLDFENGEVGHNHIMSLMRYYADRARASKANPENDAILYGLIKELAQAHKQFVEEHDITREQVEAVNGERLDQTVPYRNVVSSLDSINTERRIPGFMNMVYGDKQTARRVI